jgi:outer membrane protein assembly factor BamB
MVGLSVLFALIPLGITGIVGFSVKQHLDQAAGAMTDVLAGKADPIKSVASAVRAGGERWVGLRPPLLIAVDGDEIADVIGLVRHVHDGDRAHVTAMSGATGKPLWQSARLGTYSDTVQSRLAVSGDAVLFAGDTGQLIALNLRDGAERFKASLPDKPLRLCRVGSAAVAIETADKRWHEVALADGAVRRAQARPPRCDRLTDDERGEVDPAVSVDRSPRRWKQPGMHVNRELRRGSGPLIGTGWRRPGSAVPMVARLDARGRATWKVEVPDGNPLEARHGSGGLWTVTDRVVCATYERTGAGTRVHLTCFDLERGTRAWDLAIPGERTTVLTSLVASGDRLYLSGWGLLLGIDAASGRWVPGFTP